MGRRRYGVKALITDQPVVGLDGEPIYFPSKAKAKIARDHQTYYTGEQHAVYFGPDHLRAKESIHNV